MYIKAERKKLNISQAALAEMLGVTRLTIHNWETGKYTPPKDIDKRLKALEATSQSYTPETVITPKTHPDLYVIEGDRSYYALAHPLWWHAADLPWRHEITPEMPRTATVADLADYTPPTPEEVWEWMIPLKHFYPSQKIDFMTRRGYHQFGKAITKPPVSGYASLEDYYAAHPEQRPAKPAERVRTPQEIAEGQAMVDRMQADMDRIFNLPTNGE